MVHTRPLVLFPPLFSLSLLPCGSLLTGDSHPLSLSIIIIESFINKAGSSTSRFSFWIYEYPFTFPQHGLHIMRFLAVAALAASLVGAAPAPLDGLSSLLELATEQVSEFEVAVLGGTTLRAQQQYNENFVSGGRGPRSYLKALGKYSAFGAAIDPQLICIVDGILQELGLAGLAGADGAECNSTTTSGTGGGNGGRPSGGAGSGNGGRPGGTGTGSQAPNGTRPGNGTATGASQGMLSPHPNPQTLIVEIFKLVVVYVLSLTWRYR